MNSSNHGRSSSGKISKTSYEFPESDNPGSGK
jgi:hypothetical protein